MSKQVVAPFRFVVLAAFEQLPFERTGTIERMRVGKLSPKRAMSRLCQLGRLQRYIERRILNGRIARIAANERIAN